MSVPSEAEVQARSIVALTLVHALRRTEHIGPARSQSVSYNVVSDKLTADKFVFGLGLLRSRPWCAHYLASPSR
jgi:hypothetical protein